MQSFCQHLSFIDSIVSKNDIFESKSTSHFACIILNGELPKTTQRILQQAICVILADGGANRLLDYFGHVKTVDSKNLNNTLPDTSILGNIPTWIIGDCDSIDDRSVHHFQRIGVSLIKVYDTNVTDLHKCLDFLNSLIQNKQVSGFDEKTVEILILGGYGGRTDHYINILSELYIAASGQENSFSQLSRFNVYLINDDSLCCVLKPGVNHLCCASPYISKLCGLLPLVPVRQVTSRGLHWNLNEDSMRIGGLMSVSNQRTEETVVVTTSDPLLWFVELLKQ